MARALRISKSEQHYPNLTGVVDVNHVEKKCLVCGYISTATTFITEACQEAFKIQSGPSTCDSEKVLYLLKCKVCGEVPYVGKAKTTLRYSFNNYNSKHKAFKKGNRKVLQKLFHTHYCLDGYSGTED